MKTVKHNKTGRIYFLLNENVKNCTNANDGQIMVFYASTDGKKFTRDQDEFWTKFTQVDSEAFRMHDL